MLELDLFQSLEHVMRLDRFLPCSKRVLVGVRREVIYEDGCGAMHREEGIPVNLCVGRKHAFG